VYRKAQKCAIVRNSGKAEKLGFLKFRKDKAPHAKAESNITHLPSVERNPEFVQKASSAKLK
jgi:hypothetical protein